MKKYHTLTIWLIITLVILSCGIIFSCSRSETDTITIDLNVDNTNTNDNDNVNRGSTPSSTPSPGSPEGTPTPGDPTGDFPVNLRGTPPEEKTVSVNATKSEGVTNGVITMVVYDPDNPNEGFLYINELNSIEMFGAVGINAYSDKTVTITYTVPASWFNDGSNSFRFTHTSTSGYIVNSATVTFN